MQLKVYSYHPFHGVLTGETIADESPLEPGVYLDPAYTTRTIPPQYESGEIPVWSGERWEVLPDHRGEAWFTDSGEAVTIQVPGSPVDMGLSKEPPDQPELPAPIPSITPRQLRLWLLSRGLLAQVPTLIEAMPEPDKTVAQIEWEFATVFDHRHPFMQALGAAVGLSAEDIEAGFREAAQL